MPVVDEALLKLDRRRPECASDGDATTTSNRRAIPDTETIKVVVELGPDVVLDDRMIPLEELPDETVKIHECSAEHLTDVDQKSQKRTGIDADHVSPDEPHCLPLVNSSQSITDDNVLRVRQETEDEPTSHYRRDKPDELRQHNPIQLSAFQEPPAEADGEQRDEPPPTEFPSHASAPAAAEWSAPVVEPGDQRETASEDDAESAAVENVRRDCVHTNYHDVCERILADLPTDECPVLLLASEETQAGTDAVVVELLRVMTELSDDPVLAIDACRDRLCRAFDVASGSQSVAAAGQVASWQQRIVQTGLPGLCMLTADANETAGTPDDINELLNDLRATFGLIVIDAGSLDQQCLKTFVAAATGSYFIVRLTVTTRSWAMRTRDKIRACGNATPGCIVTVPHEVSDEPSTATETSR